MSILAFSTSLSLDPWSHWAVVMWSRVHVYFCLPFATNGLTETFLLPFTSLAAHRGIQVQLSFGFPSSITARLGNVTVFLLGGLSQVLPLHTSFFFVWPQSGVCSLAIHIVLQLHLLNSMHIKMAVLMLWRGCSWQSGLTVYCEGKEVTKLGRSGDTKWTFNWVFSFCCILNSFLVLTFSCYDVLRGILNFQISCK